MGGNTVVCPLVLCSPNLAPHGLWALPYSEMALKGKHFEWTEEQPGSHNSTTNDTCERELPDLLQKVEICHKYWASGRIYFEGD